MKKILSGLAGIAGKAMGMEANLSKLVEDLGKNIKALPKANLPRDLEATETLNELHQLLSGWNSNLGETLVNAARDPNTFAEAIKTACMKFDEATWAPNVGSEIQAKVAEAFTTAIIQFIALKSTLPKSLQDKVEPAMVSMRKMVDVARMNVVEFDNYKHMKPGAIEDHFRDLVDSFKHTVDKDANIQNLNHHYSRTMVFLDFLQQEFEHKVPSDAKECKCVFDLLNGFEHYLMDKKIPVDSQALSEVLSDVRNALVSRVPGLKEDAAPQLEISTDNKTSVKVSPE